MAPPLLRLLPRRQLLLLFAAVAAAVVAWWRRYQRMSFALYLRLFGDASLDGFYWEMARFADERAAAAAAAGRLRDLPAEMDLVCQGGGFRNVYSSGVALVAAALRRHAAGRPALARLAGASAGAQLCLIAHHAARDAGADALRLGMRWCLAVAEVYAARPLTRPEPIWRHFFSAIAHAAPTPPPGALHVAITRVRCRRRWPPLAAGCEVVSEFAGAADLTEAVMASGALPFLLCPGPLRRYRGRWVTDGGATDNLPIFTDAERPQLVVRFDVGMPARFRKIFGFTQDEVRDLARLAVDDALRLFADGAACPRLRLFPAGAHGRVPRQEGLLLDDIPPLRHLLLLQPRCAWAAADCGA